MNQIKVDQKEMIVVLKIGGSLIAENFQNVVKDIANIYHNYGEKYTLVIVHGGGAQINETLKKMGKEPIYFQTPSGFRTRYTNDEAIEAAIMALGGLNNKRLVEALQQEGVNAFGFSGTDGGTLEAKRKEKILVLIKGKRIIKRGEFSGKVYKVNPEIIKMLIKKNYMPIVSSLAKSENGTIVNTDGDRAASSIAEAIDADILISLTDVKGVYRDIEEKESLIKSLKPSQLEELMEDLKGGMKKKAYAALEAFEKGINKIIICSGLRKNPVSDALEKGAGTVIENE
ncbi:MAG: [LysW]-aminoadipate kinase [Promethearchaeia archaeon]